MPKTKSLLPCVGNHGISGTFIVTETMQGREGGFIWLTVLGYAVYSGKESMVPGTSLVQVAVTKSMTSSLPHSLQWSRELRQGYIFQFLQGFLQLDITSWKLYHTSQAGAQVLNHLCLSGIFHSQAIVHDKSQHSTPSKGLAWKAFPFQFYFQERKYT